MKSISEKNDPLKSGRYILLWRNKKVLWWPPLNKFSGKMSWKSSAPFFSNNSQKSNNITVTEGREIITDEEMRFLINEVLLGNNIDVEKPILGTAEKYERHPSILKIKEKKKRLKCKVVKEKNTYLPNYHKSLYWWCLSKRIQASSNNAYLLKNNCHCKKNNRPISILPILSIVFERCLYTRIYDHFDSILSKNTKWLQERPLW